MTDILKDISAIWIRLLDHKVFLNGEVQFSLREYEQKRNDVEVAHLFSLLEKIADIKSTQINRVQESATSTLFESNKNLREALNICSSINDLEALYQQDSTLELNRRNRKVDWEKFVDNMSNCCTQIDNTFEQKEEEVQKLYDDLQSELHTTGSLR